MKSFQQDHVCGFSYQICLSTVVDYSITFCTWVCRRALYLSRWQSWQKAARNRSWRNRQGADRPTDQSFHYLIGLARHGVWYQQQNLFATATVTAWWTISRYFSAGFLSSTAWLTVLTHLDPWRLLARHPLRCRSPVLCTLRWLLFCPTSGPQSSPTCHPGAPPHDPHPAWDRPLTSQAA